MKLIYVLTTVFLVFALSASVAHTLEEFADVLSADGSDVRLKRVKRKGGKGRGRSSGRNKQPSRSRVPPSDPYPKQPAYNPNYNPGNAYPKQPGQTYPGQTGYGQHGYPGQTGHGYPGQTGFNPGQTGYNYPGQTGYGMNMGGKYGGHGMGGMGSGLGGMGQKNKGGLGGIGAGVAGGALGAAVGAYGGYKLGKMVGKMGSMGHYGYYDRDYRFVKCDPPPRIEKDPETNITYIPRTVVYDARCDYYDRMPPQRHPMYYTSGQSQALPTIPVSIVFALISVVLGFCLDNVWHLRRPVSWLSAS